VISYGEEKPLATGDSEEAWAQNRRVELEYSSGNP
jgi:peptidoglycan-associated lipoprotein